MKAFNFEKNLDHQSKAVANTITVFENVSIIKPTEAYKNAINPKFNANDSQYCSNLAQIIKDNAIKESVKEYSNIIDIMMETGTGKTYTYAKTIFELNKKFGIFKFIVVVPTLSIKAGTINFLQSDSCREHFKEQYGKNLRLHIVESQKSNKNKKAYIPSSVSSFVNAGDFEKNSIQVMIINAGMINSDTMQKSFDKELFDKYTIPFDAIAAVQPFMIIDEPHKFGQDSITWENVKKMQPQFILRYGATFPDKEISKKNALSGKNEKITVKDYQNLIYQLTAVDSFNKNLVKGIIGHISEFESGKNATVKFIDSDGKEAKFELSENNNKKTIHLNKGSSLEKLHSAMIDLLIENLNKSTVVLSNGLELKKGQSINPYSYAQSLQEMMLEKAIKHHFDIEKKMLTRAVRIKPLTLFFIDNIEAYRNKDGNIRTTIEKLIAAEITKLLKTETNSFYKSYLEKTLQDISLTHAGYFSKDNSEKDEAIEKEINEILHDKQAILSLDNPRRFIFSKWTLREGWDNPNVFQICKLRTSGSEISKLQEVGRGLRLPVNEYGNRVKDEQFYLNYFVDFTESDFIDKLVQEINEKSSATSIEEIPVKLEANILKQIIEKYKIDEDDLIDELVDKKIIRTSHKFLAGGFEYIKQNYGLIFEGVNSNKIRKATDTAKSIIIRTDKYSELKELWEKLNEKVILEYKFDDEDIFKKFFSAYLQEENNNFTTQIINERIAQVQYADGQMVAEEQTSIFNQNTILLATMKYSDFIKELAKVLNINIKTLHHSFIASGIDINAYLNIATIRAIKQNFNFYLMKNAIDKFSIEYKKVSNSIHPTKFTNEKGEVLKEISASDIGVLFSDNEKVANNYFFEGLYYDSDLERLNIKSEITEVIVFTKIPKNSIKIPVAGGKSYSPDFAYVLNFANGDKKLHLIVETKNVVNIDGLRGEEQYKIRHAEKFFGERVKIEFKTQFSGDTITDLIKSIMQLNS